VKAIFVGQEMPVIGACTKAICCKNLQQLSMPGDNAISPGLSEFCFSWFEFF